MVIICVLITVQSVIIGKIFILDCTINKKNKREIERAKRDQMVVHVVESSSCDIYRLVWITIITPPLHTFFTKTKTKIRFFFFLMGLLRNQKKSMSITMKHQIQRCL
ncbi:hypothetical protein ACJW30_11G035400 [Castanea mollissima]